MIINAIVTIDLRADGTWKIVQLKHTVELPLPTPEPEPKPMTATEHLRNARNIRAAGRAEPVWKIAHSHCSLCGACGKKRTTHRCDGHGQHYHVGEPYNGPKCMEN
jgi:hypothetical protein